MSSLSSKSEVAAMETREASPSHFLVKIESFSCIDNPPIQTTEFDAGEYKWRLKIYPYGDDNVKDRDHISVHLAMVETSSLPANWDVNASFSIFLFNQISGDYIYSPGITRCFRAIKSEWGISKFISYDTLSDPTNGYLIKDNCVFGAEVFIVQRQSMIECLSLKNVNNVCKHTLVILGYSKLKDIWNSKEIDAGATNATYWFSSSAKTLGWPTFINIDSINDPSKGFLIKDRCLLDVEVSITALSSLSI